MALDAYSLAMVCTVQQLCCSWHMTLQMLARIAEKQPFYKL